MRKKCIGILGALTVDEIFPWKGNKIEGFGGIYYNLIILSKLFGDAAEIVPVAKIGSDIYDKFIKEIQSWGNIDTSELIRVQLPHNKVKLRYSSPGERKEFASDILPPVDVAEFNFDKRYDLLLVNFISGKELEKDTFLKICMESETEIYCDAHNLLMQIGNSGAREYLESTDWMSWFSGVNIIQLNYREAEILQNDKFNSLDDVCRFCENIVRGPVSICQVTLCKNGSVIAYKENDQIKSRKISSVEYRESLHSTGCGDAYSSGFIYEYLNSNNPVGAAEFANRIAGIKAGLKRPNELFNIKTHLKEVKYG